jgi:hypothetical protein
VGDHVGLPSWAKVVLAAVLVAGITTPSAAARRQPRYVALGDSSAAGPPIPNEIAARADATAPKVDAAIQEIHRRSPRAEVVVVGYLTHWRTGGCYPVDPSTAVDADHIQGEPPARRWLEGAVPASPAYPYHPSATGTAGAASVIGGAVSAW